MSDSAIYAGFLAEWGPTESALYYKYMDGTLPPEAVLHFERLYLVSQRLLLYKSMRVLDRVERLLEHIERREGLVE